VGDAALNQTVSTEDISCILPRTGKKNTVVVISSKAMGHGGDELGTALMKGFLYALSQQEQLPSTILFYNGGASITCEGSVSLEDLRSMEAQGVEILTCGTCLNFYGLTEKLAVGTVTNMYTIVEKMNGADLIIKP
jgi:selenium metabolism protein YedF